VQSCSPRIYSCPTSVHALIQFLTNNTLTASTEYEQRLAAAQLKYQRLDQRDNHMANYRLLIGVLGIIVACFWYNGSLATAWLIVPILCFCVLVYFHRRFLTERAAAEQKCAHYQRGLERLNNNWSHHTPTGEVYGDEDHDYAADLDLFGPGSLFQLVNSAQTRFGEDRLADWLAQGAERKVTA